MSRICPHCLREVRYHNGVVGMCGDVRKLRAALEKVIAKLSNSGFQPHGPSLARFYPAEIVTLQSSLTSTPPAPQDGRPADPLTIEQVAIMEAHFVQWQTRKSRELAKAAGITPNKAWRWLYARSKYEITRNSTV